MHEQGQFDEFGRFYEAWTARTDAVQSWGCQQPEDGSIVRISDFAGGLRHVLARAYSHSTELDYPRLAAGFLRDLDRLQEQIEGIKQAERERDECLAYLAETRRLIECLGSLPVPPEGHLGFRKTALDVFGFLAEEYGFELLETSPTDVRFAVDRVSVSISYWPQTPQGGVDVEAHDVDGPVHFYLDHFAFVAGQGLVFDYGRFDYRTETGLAEYLRAAAALVRRYGDGVLRGDGHAIRRFEERAEERERLYVQMLERGTLGK